MVGMIIVGVFEIVMGIYVYCENQWLFEDEAEATLALIAIVVFAAAKSFVLAFTMDRQKDTEKLVNGEVTRLKDQIHRIQSLNQSAAYPRANPQPQGQPAFYGNGMTGMVEQPIAVPAYPRVTPQPQSQPAFYGNNGTTGAAEQPAAAPAEKAGQPAYCPNCGTKRVDSGNQCQQCGHRF